MNKRSKALALALACMLLVVGLVGGTLAWLTATSGPVTNTFSPSDIGVELEETTTGYKMIPGWDIAKDPKAWITSGSEDAYLFVKVVKSANFDAFMTYTIAEGWYELEDGVGVYYREVTANQQGEANAFPILAGDKVTVKETVTKEMMNALTAETQPTLTFTAYAHQLKKNSTETFEPAEAWANLNPATGA